jgi:cupin 2 domain-containing protein
MVDLQNVFERLPDNARDEIIETLVKSRDLRIERIISRGHASPDGFWYDQPQHEFVLLLSGAARLRFEDDDRTLNLIAGDYLTIPAHRRHRVDWTTPDEPSVWLAVFYNARRARHHGASR